MATLSINNLYKSYDEKNYVVNNANLEISDGEFVVLVGPSGCGKSTILRMIAGLEEITKGEIYIDRNKINHKSPKERDIAMVFQNYAIYPHMTVYENISFGLKIRKLSKNEINEKVNKASEILGLSELLHRKPKQLSGGQRQRVALGRAIVRNPKVFLFDEPLSNLDAKLRVQMRTEIAKLHSKLKTTMVYVTHDQTEAMTMGDRIVIMNKGEIQQIAEPMTLYNSPVNRFVAGFIGSPAMNFLFGKIENDFSILINSPSKEMRIKLTEDHRNRFKNLIGNDIVIGIRAEDFAFSLDENKIPFKINVEIDLIEPLGNETFIYFTLAYKQIVARVFLDKILKVGDKIELFVDTAKLHFFDQKSGLSI